jgi:hypothetical protein
MASWILIVDPSDFLAREGFGVLVVARNPSVGKFAEFRLDTATHSRSNYGCRLCGLGRLEGVIGDAIRFIFNRGCSFTRDKS